MSAGCSESDSTDELDVTAKIFFFIFLLTMLIQSPDNSFHHETFNNKYTHSINGKSHGKIYNGSCRDPNGGFSMENNHCNNHCSIANALSKDSCLVNINLEIAKDKSYEIGYKYNSNCHLPNVESVATIENSAVADVSVDNLNTGNVILLHSDSSENYDNRISKCESFLFFQSSDVRNGNFKKNIPKNNPNKKRLYDHCPREIYLPANKEKRNALSNHEKCTEEPTHYQS